MGHIAFINYTGRRGSGTMIAYESAKALIEIGVEVVAVVSEYVENLDLWKLLPLKELIIIKTYQNKASFVTRTVAFMAFEKRKLKKRLNKYDFDYVYCPMIALWSDMINQLLPKSCFRVTANHDPIPHSGEGGRQNVFWQETIYRHSDIIIVHSRRFIDFVQKKYNVKTVYVPLGKHDTYKILENKKTLLTYDDQLFHFLFFGRISSYKGLQYLAQAYKKLSQERKDISLTVVGNGDFTPYQELYADLYNTRVFNQWVADEEVESIFTGEKLIAVVPYTDATQSGVALVAMGYGVPVIATDVGGISEQITDGENGLLVAPKDTDALYAAMKRLIEDSELYQRLSVNGRRYSDLFQWENVMEKINSLTA